MFSSRERQWLADIIENIDYIDQYVEAMSMADFSADRKTVDATERCLERIIEAIVRIGPDRMSSILTTLPAQAVRGMGNRLRHEYEAISISVIWTTITDDLPPLRAACIFALSA